MRTQIQLDLAFAQECIRKNEPVSRHISDLVKLTASLYNEKFGVNYSPTLFYLRIKSGELHTSLKPGKRGRPAGIALSSEQKEAMQKGRTRERKIRTADLPALKKMHPEYSLLCEKVAAGSKTAAIKLKCLNCTCFQIKEISLCTSTDCALHSFRPYRKKND